MCLLPTFRTGSSAADYLAWSLLGYHGISWDVKHISSKNRRKLRHFQKLKCDKNFCCLLGFIRDNRGGGSIPAVICSVFVLLWGRGQLLEEQIFRGCQTACKPGSVRPKAGRSFLWDLHCCRPHATNPNDGARSPRLPCGNLPFLFGLAPGRVYRDHRRCRRCGALLPHRFALTRNVFSLR